MKKAYNEGLRMEVFVGVIDWLTFNAVLVVIRLWGIWLTGWSTDTLIQWVVLNVSYFIGRMVVHITLHHRWSSIATILRNACGATVLTVLSNAAILGMAHYGVPGFYRSLAMAAVIFVLLAMERSAVRRLIKYLRFKGHNAIDAIIIGDYSSALRVIRVMSNKWNGYHLIGLFNSGNTAGTAPDNRYDGGDLELDADEMPQHIGTVDDAATWLKAHSVDEVFICIKGSGTKEISAVLKVCMHNIIRVFYIPSGDITYTRNMHYKEFGDTYVVALYNEPLMSPVSRLIKRAFDICFSLAILVFVFPIVWIVVSIVTMLTMPGPIIFRQRRTGYDGREFTCYKFRSMKVNKDADTVQATKDDERVTKWGHILRHTNIDEIPQFWNVLIGDMSVVGPRPHMLKHTDFYSAEIEDYMVRHYVRPGITGWAQTHDSRGETKTVDDMRDRVRKDIWYIEHWSFWLDIQIILTTIRKMFISDKKAY